MQDNKAAAGTHSPSREARGMPLGGYGRECAASAAGRLIPAAGGAATRARQPRPGRTLNRASTG